MKESSVSVFSGPGVSSRSLAGSSRRAWARSGGLCAGLAFFSGVGCSDGATIIGAPPENIEASAEAGPPAVLVTGLVPTVEGYNLYVAALPEVPSGDLDYSRFREVSATDSYVYTHGGYVFVWDGTALRMTRYSVDAELNLVEGPTLSMLGQAAGASNHVFISSTRAYSLSTELDQIIVWNPASMEITGSIPMAALDRPATMSSFAYYGRGEVVGDNVFWEIVSTDDASGVAHPAVTLAIASASSDEPVQIVEDGRCVGGGGGRVDALGDYYIRAGALWGQYAALGEDAARVRTCMLRVKAGERTFDPDYLRDFRDLTGSYVNYPWFHVTGSQYLAHAWDPGVPLPADLDAYYAPDATTRFRQLLVDVEASTAVPYPHLAGGRLISSDEYSVDGVSYYQFSQTGYVEGGSTDVVELHADGIVQRFHVPGSLWALARIR